MKRLAMLALLVAACGAGDNADNRREIEKPALVDAPGAPFSAIDDALRTEATLAAATIRQQITVAAVRQNDVTAFYDSLNGQLDAGKLQKLGMTANDLAGKHYKPSDYHISITGKTLVVTASKPGTRGYKSEEFTLR